MVPHFAFSVVSIAIDQVVIIFSIGNKRQTMDYLNKLEIYLNKNGLKMTAPERSSLNAWMTSPVTLHWMIF